jgi:hypothetical protein
MLHNVNLNIVNLKTLTLCLSICNRMVPPTQHPLYPLLEVEYDDQHRTHILSDTDTKVALPPLRPARTPRCMHTMRVLHTTRTPSTSTCGGFTGL